MSMAARAILTAVAAGDQATETPFRDTAERAASPLSISDPAYVPLATRTCDQLQTKARELRRMAATATTADVVRALLALADRYDTLAERRRSAQGL
jgi:hypothetical protein